MTRRDILRWSALAVTSAGVATITRGVPVLGQSPPPGTVVGRDLELVTLTEDRAVLTWYTGLEGSDDGFGRIEAAPADAEVHWGTDPARLDRIIGGPGGTPYHRVEIAGLEPGRTYFYRAFSAGRRAAAMTFTFVAGDAVNSDGLAAPVDGPFSFTTPQPPPGRFLFSIALCNDLHLGETVAGLSGALPGLEGISQVPGARPYPTLMTEALVREASEAGARYMLAAGDITSGAAPPEVGEAKALLDGFGERQTDWFAARGNHDRAREGERWASCSVGRWQGNDCFADGFFPAGEPTFFSRELHGLRVIGIDTYDKAGNGGDSGGLAAEQMAWFRRELSSSADQPTIVFGHHPLVAQAHPLPDLSGTTIDPGQSAAIVDAYRSTPGLFLHHAGHTHRNRRSAIEGIPHVAHQEVAAVKEYPGGFTLLRIHEGGYAINFHKLRSDEARAWSERSRMQIAGLWPQFALGTRVSDRNLVVERDLSGISAPTEVAPSVPTTTTTPGGTDPVGSSPVEPSPSPTAPPSASPATPLIAVPAYTG